MSNTATLLRRIGVAATTAATGLTLVACSGTTPKSAPAPSAPSSQTAPTGAHNQQDVMFAQMMIPHHQQAITMSDTELKKGQSKQVKQLATTIKDAQGPEIKRMNKWLATWKAPATSENHMMHHGTGMMSPEQMSKFNKANGKTLDRMFLQMMIDHHQGAIDMARPEQQHGQDAQARKLADSIITSQQAQITQMKRMLTTA